MLLFPGYVSDFSFVAKRFGTCTDSYTTRTERSSPLLSLHRPSAIDLDQKNNPDIFTAILFCFPTCSPQYWFWGRPLATVDALCLCTWDQRAASFSGFTFYLLFFASIFFVSNFFLLFNFFILKFYVKIFFSKFSISEIFCWIFFLLIFCLYEKFVPRLFFSKIYGSQNILV